MYEGSIASLTPTLCSLFGIPAPALSSEPPLASIRRHAQATLADTPIQRCLVYCPDALGDVAWSHFPDQAAAITAHYPHRVHLSSVLPPKTPVCFASIFSGATPASHGIRQYERPVLTCDTLFDALTRAGRRVALVAVRNSSIDLIFRNRPLDYFSEEYDAQATERALALLTADQHDLIVVYHQEYDDQLHATEPFSDACVQALHNHVASAARLAQAAKAAWSQVAHALVVAPDHGAHRDPQTGHGDHGQDTPDDMAVSHWYGLPRPRK